MQERQLLPKNRVKLLPQSPWSWPQQGLSARAARIRGHHHRRRRAPPTFLIAATGQECPGSRRNAQALLDGRARRMTVSTRTGSSSTMRASSPAHQGMAVSPRPGRRYLPVCAARNPNKIRYRIKASQRARGERSVKYNSGAGFTFFSIFQETEHKELLTDTRTPRSRPPARSRVTSWMIFCANF